MDLLHEIRRFPKKQMPHRHNRFYHLLPRTKLVGEFYFGVMDESERNLEINVESWEIAFNYWRSRKFEV